MEYETKYAYWKLIANWKQYKELETLANEGRLKTEKELAEMLGDDLKYKGTNNFPDGLQVITGFNEVYDQDALDNLKRRFDDGLSQLPYFPFDATWKPNSKKIAALKESCPDIFDEEMAEALTIKPKKPAFKIKENK